MLQKSFEVKLVFKERKIKDFFKYYRITIPAPVRKNWINAEGTGKYKLSVDDALISRISMIDPDSASILTDIKKWPDNEIEIQANEGCYKMVEVDGKYVDVYSNYIGIFSNYLWNKLSVLFMATFVNQENESKEGFTLEFIPSSMEVILKDVVLDIPEGNPYYAFARKTAMYTTFQTINIKADSDKPKKSNYYDFDAGTEWKDVSVLADMASKSIEVSNVVYMLYDNVHHRFYVGKANKLVKRLIQHQEDTTDLIKDFTHFRYTPVTPDHIDEIYLIENAAIHDCAAIFNMPSGKFYKDRDLQNHVFEGKFDVSIEMVNNVEKQTK